MIVDISRTWIRDTRFQVRHQPAGNEYTSHRQKHIESAQYRPPDGSFGKQFLSDGIGSNQDTEPTANDLDNSIGIPVTLHALFDIRKIVLHFVSLSQTCL